MAKKITIDEAHGAQGVEMSDEDVAELEADTRSDAEVNAEPPVETPEDTDLPEGITEPPEVPELAEPVVDPEVERLKELGLYRPGMVESWEDVGKSYKHLEAEFSRRPTVEKPVEPQVDQERMMEDLQEEMISNPVAAVAKISNAMQANMQAELNKLKDGVFYGNHSDANDFKAEIGEIQKELPGIGMQDAFDLAKGRNSDKVIAQATQTEKRRATSKMLASREKPGGVRTAPVDADKAIAAAAAGGGSAQEIIARMQKVLNEQNMGVKE